MPQEPQLRQRPSPSRLVSGSLETPHTQRTKQRTRRGVTIGARVTESPADPASTAHHVTGTPSATERPTRALLRYTYSGGAAADHGNRPGAHTTSSWGGGHPPHPLSHSPRALPHGAARRGGSQRLCDRLTCPRPPPPAREPSPKSSPVTTSMVLLLPSYLPRAERGTYTLAEQNHESTGERQVLCEPCPQGPSGPGLAPAWPGPHASGRAAAVGP